MQIHSCFNVTPTVSAVFKLIFDNMHYMYNAVNASIPMVPTDTRDLGHNGNHKFKVWNTLYTLLIAFVYSKTGLNSKHWGSPPPPRHKYKITIDYC